VWERRREREACACACACVCVSIWEGGPKYSADAVNATICDAVKSRRVLACEWTLSSQLSEPSGYSLTERSLLRSVEDGPTEAKDLFGTLRIMAIKQKLHHHLQNGKPKEGGGGRG
jgi:hypothetical protein